ncbi:MAG: hypothetical protein P8J33_14550 [Pirellulaceae bacterium]|nr:hypothetical protein [Pirellulaceae bacterium]
MSPHSDLQAQLNKRFSLNLLIQGAASHTYLTAHHLVKQELEAIQPGLLRLYDKMSLNVHLSQWIGDLVFAVGFPKQFWNSIDQPEHPFAGHPFLVKHGKYLSQQSKRHTIARARKRGVSTTPGIQYAQTFWLLGRTVMKEKIHRIALAEAAVSATHQIWGIDPTLLSGTITGNVEFGELQKPTTRAGRILRNAAAGYGGVIKGYDGRLRVHARAWMWPLLSHELTKGTAELVCMHGLNHLDDETYQYVTREADKIEHEIWMMQAGGELWRLFIAAIPSSDLLAKSLMHVARMEPEPLEQLLMDLIEHPFTAKATIADFFDADGLDDNGHLEFPDEYLGL